MKPVCCKEKKSLIDVSKTTEYLKVIADDSRLRILCMLQDGEKCVCDIWSFLEIPQNLASHHLKVLKDFGLIASRKSGLKVFYSINKKAICTYTTLLNKFLLRTNCP